MPITKPMTIWWQQPQPPRISSKMNQQNFFLNKINTPVKFEGNMICAESDWPRCCGWMAIQRAQRRWYRRRRPTPGPSNFCRRTRAPLLRCQCMALCLSAPEPKTHRHVKSPNFTLNPKPLIPKSALIEVKLKIHHQTSMHVKERKILGRMVPGFRSTHRHPSSKSRGKSTLIRAEWGMSLSPPEGRLFGAPSVGRGKLRPGTRSTPTPAIPHPTRSSYYKVILRNSCFGRVFHPTFDNL